MRSIYVFYQFLFTPEKVSSHKSNLDRISNLVGKYWIYCLSHPAQPSSNIWFRNIYGSQICSKHPPAIRNKLKSLKVAKWRRNDEWWMMKDEEGGNHWFLAVWGVLLTTDEQTFVNVESLLRLKIAIIHSYFSNTKCLVTCNQSDTFLPASLMFCRSNSKLTLKSWKVKWLMNIFQSSLKSMQFD